MWHSADSWFTNHSGQQQVVAGLIRLFFSFPDTRGRPGNPRSKLPTNSTTADGNHGDACPARLTDVILAWQLYDRWKIRELEATRDDLAEQLRSLLRYGT